MVRAVLIAAVCIACRVDHVGFPVDTGDWVVQAPVWDGDEIPVGCTAEVEPNDLQTKTAKDVDWMGLIHPDRFGRYCGRLQGPNDVDAVAFQLLERGLVTVIAVPQSPGSVDLLVVDANADDPTLVAGGGPWSGTLRAGVHAIVVASSSGDTPEYRLDLKVE